MRGWIPENEIQFAARSGFLTRKLWLKHFAGQHQRSWNHKRWHRLTESGVFLEHPSSICQGVLLLNRDAPLVQQLYSGAPAKSPYVAELKHDETLYDGFLRLEEEGLVQDYSTEEELAKIEVSGFVSTTERLKLPDLLVTTISGRSLAIEVELTQKSRARYRGIFEAYRDRGDVDAVLFVVPNRSVIRTVLRGAEDIGYPFKARPVGFLSVESWTLDPAHRKMSFGESVTTLSEFMKRSAKSKGTFVS